MTDQPQNQENKSESCSLDKAAEDLIRVSNQHTTQQVQTGSLDTQSLSEKIALKEVSDTGSLAYQKRFILYRDDVSQSIQEFLKELKEELPKATICTYSEKIYKIHQVIDTLAKQKFGDKLL